MEEAGELAIYLPLSSKTLKEQEYVEFMWDAFEMNTQTTRKITEYFELFLPCIPCVPWLRMLCFERSSRPLVQMQSNLIARQPHPF